MCCPVVPGGWSATWKLAYYSCLGTQHLPVIGRGQSKILHFTMTTGIVNDRHEGNHHHIFNHIMSSRR